MKLEIKEIKQSFSVYVAR